MRQAATRIAAAERIRSRFDIPVVYLTGFAEKDVLDRAKKTEPYGYLGKPITMLELRSTIDTALYKHEADRRVRESDARFQLFMKHLPGLAYIKDAEGRILFANRGFQKYLGIDESAIVGKTNYDFFPTILLPFFRDDMRRLAKFG